MVNHNIKTYRQEVRGFTIIEICFVLILSGFLFATFLATYQSYSMKKSDQKTIENMDLTHQALREFFSLQGRYPCPANPGLAPGNPQYGRESCRVNITDPCPAGLTCTNVGSRDADGDTVSDPVAIGVVPFVTLAENILMSEFRPTNARDGFHMQLSYAVSELMTDQIYTVSTPANAQLGAVAVRDEHGAPLMEPVDSAHYVILSHGENKRGAYSIEGVRSDNCNVTIIVGPPPVTAPPPPGPTFSTAGIKTETENCDENDAIFANGLTSLADNDDYYDDTLYFNAMVSQRLWRPSNFSPTGTTYIYNTNVGNVGVGLTDPNTKLHVNGNIKADFQMEAESGYCDLDGDDCVDADGLGGTNMQDIASGSASCPTGQVINSIEDNNFNCIDLFPSSPPASTCAPGEFVKRIVVNGTGTTPGAGYARSMSVVCARP